MKTRTFKAREMKEALALVRQELGPDALIVSTRQVAPLLGLGTPLLEVTATAPAGKEAARPLPDGGAPRLLNLAGGRAYAPGPHPSHAPAAPHRELARADHDGWFRDDGDLSAVVTRQRVAPPPPPPPRAKAAPVHEPDERAMDERLLPLQREVRALRAQLQQVTQSSAVGPTLQKEVDELRAVLRAMNGDKDKGSLSPDVARLLHHGLDRPLAESLLQRARELGGDPDAALRRAVTERVTIAGPVGVSARVAAFIGPTGVGKTTTIAKIAARAALMDGAKVALVTVDTFRVGAIDQLQRYADLMELPLHVAGTSSALRAAVQSNAGADLILLDTAGRGPRDVAQLAALRELLGSADSVEVHLCLSATTRSREQALALQSYRPLQPTRLCITKLDEAVSLGEIVSLHISTRLPLSYLGTGQRVPEDLELCTPEGLCDRLLQRPAPAEANR